MLQMEDGWPSESSIDYRLLAFTPSNSNPLVYSRRFHASIRFLLWVSKWVGLPHGGIETNLYNVQCIALQRFSALHLRHSVFRALSLYICTVSESGSGTAKVAGDKVSFNHT